MTQLEQRTLSLLANACAKYIANDNQDNINWEQRKYETAKDYAIGLLTSQWFTGSYEQAIERGLEFAESFIEKLKND